MCGFAGIIGPSVSRKTIDSMLGGLAHRGPDGHGVYCCQREGLALAHARLAIHDLSDAGIQPFFVKTEPYLLVFNGEIYNFRALRLDLQVRGYTFTTSTDTEVLYYFLIDAVKGRGKDFSHAISRLDGMFAFAFIDLRSRKCIIAKDRFGIKPLYYAVLRDSFYFSSEIAPLIELKGEVLVSRKSLRDLIKYLWIPSPETIDKEIKKLEQGNILFLDLDRPCEFESHRYHQFSWSSSKIYKAANVLNLEVLLESSIEDQLSSDRNIGVFLSGGIDSSLITMFAARHVKNLPCYSLRIDGSEPGVGGELAYARQVAKMAGADLKEVEVKPSDFVRGIEDFQNSFDEPGCDPAAFCLGKLAEAASKENTPVCLTGMGGDELFAGYRRHSALKVFENIPFRNGCRNMLGFGYLGRGIIPLSDDFWRRYQKAYNGLDNDIDTLVSNYFRWISQSELQRFLDFDVSAFGLDRLMLALRDQSNDLNTVDKCLDLEKRYFLPDHNLHYADKFSMRHGIELRVPMLSNDLGHFSSRMGVSEKISFFDRKKPLKKLAAKYFNRQFVYRKKKGFGLPIRVWLDGVLGEFLNDTVLSNDFKNRGFFNQANILKAMKNGYRGSSGEDVTYPILMIVCFEYWIRHYEGKDIKCG